MAVINKIYVDGTTYDVQDANLTATVNALSMPYSDNTEYASGTLGEVVKGLSTGSDIATNSDILAALYS